MLTKEESYQCHWCGEMAGETLFAISREFERLCFTGLSAGADITIDVDGSESIALFCSRKCRNQGGTAAMATQHVPIPATKPSLVPVEICAICHGPVDMSDWHLSFLKSDTNAWIKQHKRNEVKYIAILCRKCAPFRRPLTKT